MTKKSLLEIIMMMTFFAVCMYGVIIIELPQDLIPYIMLIAIFFFAITFSTRKMYNNKL